MNDITNHEKSSNINTQHQKPSNIIKHDRPGVVLIHFKPCPTCFLDGAWRYAEVNATIFRDTEEGMLLQMLFAAWPKTADLEPTFHLRGQSTRPIHHGATTVATNLGRYHQYVGMVQNLWFACREWWNAMGRWFAWPALAVVPRKMTGMVWQHVLCPPQHWHQPTPSGDRNDRTVNNKINALRRCMSCYLVIYGIILPID